MWKMKHKTEISSFLADFWALWASDMQTWKWRPFFIKKQRGTASFFAWKKIKWNKKVWTEICIVCCRRQTIFLSICIQRCEYEEKERWYKPYKFEFSRHTFSLRFLKPNVSIQLVLSSRLKHSCNVWSTGMKRSFF